MLTTSNRLRLVNPGASGEDVAAKKALETVFYDVVLDDELNGYFQTVFGKDLILQRAGPAPEYHCTEPDEFERGLNISVRDLVEKLPETPKLDDQGDGMKAFAGVVLDLLSSPAFVRLIDEPRVFSPSPSGKSIGKRHWESGK